jgi:hypothetical protein
MVIKELFSNLSKGDLCLFKLVAQKGAHMLKPLGKKTFALISNALGQGMAPSYSHLLPPTRIGKNPTKTWKL